MELSRWYLLVGILSDRNVDVVNGSDRRYRLRSCGSLVHQAASSNDLKIYFHDRAYRMVMVGAYVAASRILLIELRDTTIRFWG
jgi:hypothetical protein